MVSANYYELMTKNQHGVSTFALLFFVLTLAIIGFGGWYVWRSNQPAQNNPTTQQSQDTKPETKKPKIEKTQLNLSSAQSDTCNYITFDEAIADNWVNHLSQTDEIKKLEQDKAPEITYRTIAGSVCELTDENTLVSFSNIKTTQTTQLDSETKHSYGLFVFSPNNAVLHSSTDLSCANIPPDPSWPPTLNNVVSGKVTLKCPGYDGATYVYDFSTKLYTK